MKTKNCWIIWKIHGKSFNYHILSSNFSKKYQTNSFSEYVTPPYSWSLIERIKCKLIFIEFFEHFLPIWINRIANFRMELANDFQFDSLSKIFKMIKMAVGNTCKKTVYRPREFFPSSLLLKHFSKKKVRLNIIHQTTYLLYYSLAEVRKSIVFRTFSYLTQ